MHRLTGASNVGGEARFAAHQPSHTTTATPQGVASTDQLGLRAVEKMMALDKTCTASQLVARLQALIAQHGDLPVYARDADTLWRLPIGLMFREAQPAEERPARFEITTEYHGRPRADFEQA